MSRDIFSMVSKQSDVNKIIKNSKDENEVKQAEFIMFAWDEFKEHPDNVREMYEVIIMAQKVLNKVKK